MRESCDAVRFGAVLNRHTSQTLRVVLATVLIGVLLASVGCGGHGSSGGSGRLDTIASMDQFERAFDDDAGHPRLVLLLSPT
jgi:hypothetical protein